MDLQRVKDEDKLELCRKYYIEYPCFCEILKMTNKYTLNNKFIKLAVDHKSLEDLQTSPTLTYILGGFALLPFLWFVNSIWFFNEAFRKPAYVQQKMIRTYVIRSMIGTLLWIGAVTAWITVFQLNRVSWGATGDYISFVVPKGRA